MFLKRLGAFFFDTLQVIVSAIAIFLFIYLLVLQPHKIKGASMEPNFPNGEFLLTDKVTYRLDDPKRGDVIVFKAPPDFEEEFIKRIVGLPGEIVLVRAGKVYINGRFLEESYLSPSLITHPGAFLAEGEEITVPADNYLAFGDNRPHSSDSRAWGFVPRDKITGRAWVIYWPPQNAGLIEKAKYNLTL